MPQIFNRGLIDIGLKFLGVSVVYQAAVYFMVLFLFIFSLNHFQVFIAYLVFNLVYLLLCAYFGYRLQREIKPTLTQSLAAGLVGILPLFANLLFLMHYLAPSNRDHYDIFDLSGLTFKVVSWYSEAADLGDSLNMLIHLAIIPLALFCVVAGAKFSKRVTG